jgi:hypothetical protein
MADTGEDREIKGRTDAKEAEIVSESQKLRQKSKTARDQALDKRRRQARQPEAPKPPATNALFVPHKS